jgi:hypothetical protein
LLDNVRQLRAHHVSVLTMMADTTTVQSVTGEVLGTFATATPLCDVCQQLGLDADETTFFDAAGAKVDALHGDVTQAVGVVNILRADALKALKVSAATQRLRALRVMSKLNRELGKLNNRQVHININITDLVKDVPKDRHLRTLLETDIHMVLMEAGYAASRNSESFFTVFHVSLW